MILLNHNRRENMSKKELVTEEHENNIQMAETFNLNSIEGGHNQWSCSEGSKHWGSDDWLKDAIDNPCPIEAYLYQISGTPTENRTGSRGGIDYRANLLRNNDIVTGTNYGQHMPMILFARSANRKPLGRVMRFEALRPWR